MCALAVSKLAFQSQAGGRRSCRAAMRAGHCSRMCSEVRSPQLHCSGGSPGWGSEGVVFVCSRNSALRGAGLYARSSLGNVVVGANGDAGSIGFLVDQSFSLCWSAAARSYMRVVRVCLHWGLLCAPSFARASARSLPGIPQWAGVHRPVTFQPASCKLWP